MGWNFTLDIKVRNHANDNYQLYHTKSAKWNPYASHHVGYKQYTSWYVYLWCCSCGWATHTAGRVTCMWRSIHAQRMLASSPPSSLASSSASLLHSSSSLTSSSTAARDETGPTTTPSELNSIQFNSISFVFSRIHLSANHKMKNDRPLHQNKERTTHKFGCYWYAFIVHSTSC